MNSQSRRVANPAEDFYHCPCGPDDYLEIRLDSLIHFYETRIPKYCTYRNRVQLLTVVFSAASSFLAALEFPEYIPIVAVVGSSVTGWAEFRAISKKLQRYNFVARNLQSLRLWWTP